MFVGGRPSTGQIDDIRRSGRQECSQNRDRYRARISTVGAESFPGPVSCSAPKGFTSRGFRPLEVFLLRLLRT